ncbi:hypothetical protein BFW38_04325 [Terasakiispira papahanaumokuakeensis]|uniref:Glucose-1-phosphate thymidylyltransferase n=1 Tax=Terasakiispira papahanaumokuakeensis TaxID=197479 RepID=A0A1E2V7J9_9GAMM|nr:DUF4389 domain-containing protein [Terasakiispira papahanaumokuakeensis]ODC02893.1 hypothetical protein BFW38_04325 [Terasakiispira papahanaumokuakeensis]
MNEPKPSLMKDEQFWLRLPFMLLFFLAYQITELVIFGVILIQLLYRMLMGERQMQLLRFGAQLSQYAYECFRYLTFNTETKPFPFAEWPLGEAPERNPYMPTAETSTTDGVATTGRAATTQEASTSTSASEEKTSKVDHSQDSLDEGADAESGQTGSHPADPRA